MSHSARSHLIRGARLLDAANGSAPFRDLLVVNGAIAEIAEAGAISAESVQAFDATDRMIIPGPCERAFAFAWIACEGPWRQMDARAPAQCRPVDELRATDRGQVSLRIAERRRACQQGLYRSLRSLWRIPGPHARGLRGDRTRLQRCRDARGRGADGCGPKPVSGHPGADRQHSRGSARRTYPGSGFAA